MPALDMSAKNKALPRLFAARQLSPLPRVRAMDRCNPPSPALAKLSGLATLVVLACAGVRPALAQAAPVLSPSVVAQALALAEQAARALAPAVAHIDVSAGTLSPRLQLAPCARVLAFQAAGAPAWGQTRVGLRCEQGATRWTVYLPVTVRVFAPAVVTTAALPAGARLDEQTLTLAETDWAATHLPPFADARALAGRVLSRPLATGQAPRAADLQPRQWFALGETVRVVLTGAGYAISADAQALTPGLEGKPARVRTESGRILVGLPVAEHRLEVPL